MLFGIYLPVNLFTCPEIFLYCMGFPWAILSVWQMQIKEQDSAETLGSMKNLEKLVP
jgi:hypothetical protein